MVRSLVAAEVGLLAVEFSVFARLERSHLMKVAELERRCLLLVLSAVAVVVVVGKYLAPNGHLVVVVVVAVACLEPGVGPHHRMRFLLAQSQSRLVSQDPIDALT